MKRVFLFLAAVASLVAGYVFLLSVMRGSPSDVGSVAAALILAISVWALNRKFFRWEGRSIADIGFILSLSWQSYAGFNVAGGASRIAFCVFNNTGEELAYRGYLIKKLDARFGKAIAVLATSILFAVLHVQAGVPGKAQR